MILTKIKYFNIFLKLFIIYYKCIEYSFNMTLKDIPKQTHTKDAKSKKQMSWFVFISAI